MLKYCQKLVKQRKFKKRMFKINNVLSLFDGISCGQIALDRANIQYNNYYASEIDKYAIKVTQTNYPKTIQLGDVTKIDYKNLPTIELLIGGSPCSGFSFAGKQLNFNDPQSKLFFEYVRLLKELKPKWFLLENVRMKKEYQDVISQHLGVKPIMINSSLVSAQNRVRLYWTNIPNIKLPIDKNIKLKDIIQEDYDGIWVYPRGYNLGGVQSYNEKSPSITTSNWQYNFMIYNKDPTGAGLRGYKNDGKWIQIPTLNKNNKSYTLTASGRNKTDFVYVNEKVRRFTPIETEKLQTVPENYTKILNSKNQRYKCLGNCWTVDVITHIFSFLK